MQLFILIRQFWLDLFDCHNAVRGFGADLTVGTAVAWWSRWSRSRLGTPKRNSVQAEGRPTG